VNLIHQTFKAEFVSNQVFLDYTWFMNYFCVTASENYIKSPS